MVYDNLGEKTIIMIHSIFQEPTFNKCFYTWLNKTYVNFLSWEAPFKGNKKGICLRGVLIKERICSIESKFFPLGVAHLPLEASIYVPEWFQSGLRPRLSIHLNIRCIFFSAIDEAGEIQDVHEGHINSSQPVSPFFTQDVVDHHGVSFWKRVALEIVFKSKCILVNTHV